MAHTRAWRNFRRMQDITLAAAVLLYAAAVLHALEVLPGGTARVLRWVLLWPGLYFLASLVVPLAIAPVRRWLARYVWMSFRAGFGQTPLSVVTGICLLMAAALFIYREIHAVAATGSYRANVFSAYAAGIGIVAAQTFLVRALERLPDVKAQIEEP